MFCVILSQFPRGRKTSKTQCLHRLCVEIGPPTPETHLKLRRCYADLIVCSGRSFLVKLVHNFKKKCDGFLKKIVKSMPAIVVCTVSRGHETSKTQCLHWLCVESDPPTPKTLLKMRGCYADLIVFSGRIFLVKWMQYFENKMAFCKKILNPCQPSWLGIENPQNVKNSMFAQTLCWNWPTHAQHTS